MWVCVYGGWYLWRVEVCVCEYVIERERERERAAGICGIKGWEETQLLCLHIISLPLSPSPLPLSLSLSFIFRVVLFFNLEQVLKHICGMYTCVCVCVCVCLCVGVYSGACV